MDLDSYDTATGGLEQPAAAARDDLDPTPSHAEPGTTGKAVNTWVGFLILAGVTSVVASIEMVATGSLGWFTGIAFVLCCIGVALVIRRADLATAVISAPLAFLLAVVVSTQFTAIGASGNLWLHEATTIITSLAFSAPWVFAGTGAALIIVLMRGAAARRAAKSA